MRITEKGQGGYNSRGRRWAGPKLRAHNLRLLLFTISFLKHPKSVGWFLPSSRFVVDEVLSQIDWSQARVIVEYGAGIGVFTYRVLDRMRPDATLIALEINSELFRFLSSSLRDPRLHLVPDSAVDIDRVLKRFGFSHVDYVISGIPFKPMPPVLRETIVRKTHSVLRPNGGFLVYQFSSAVLPCLERVFNRVSRGFEPLNILPTKLFFCAR